MSFSHILGFNPGNIELYQIAVRHRSVPFKNKHGELVNNERLEFLGDSVVSLILARELFDRMPHKREGVLTRSRAALAKRALLSSLALELGIDAQIRISEAEDRNGGRLRPSTLEDALESVAGAVYIDSNFDTVRDVVLGWYGDLHERLSHLMGTHNPKGQLQELIQPTMGNDAIVYTIIGEDGPPHMRSFKVRVDISGKPMGEGAGACKKEAEENAAREALAKMSASTAEEE